jgi:tyrosine-protein phosphatase SIW14
LYRIKFSLHRASVCLQVFAVMMAFAGSAIAPSCAGAAGVARSKDTSEQTAIGRHLKAVGLPNFGQVTPTLYRGGQPSADGFERLASMGIKIVVDTTRSTHDEALVEKLGMTYVALPWYCSFPKDRVFDRFMEIVRKNPQAKIFVHCRLGEDRTGMMIAAYRMAQDGWTARQAMIEMHDFGFSRIHHFTCPGLARYEHSFPNRLTNDPAFDNLR